jgi:hypothetical protein
MGLGAIAQTNISVLLNAIGVLLDDSGVLLNDIAIAQMNIVGYQFKPGQQNPQGFAASLNLSRFIALAGSRRLLIALQIAILPPSPCGLVAYSCLFCII